MARRGRFGRLPRAAPSLTNTIVAIAREMQNQRDKNIMDAWQRGGTFEGKKVTDDMVVDHWRNRLKGVDKADPLYDTYKNTVTQYEYTIAESKASTAYAQGKLSDAGMAKFYLNWSKKIPKNSEFYRVLQRNAAQFMRAARARGAAGAAKAKESAYQQSQDRTFGQYEAAGEYLTNTLRTMAQSAALIGLNDSADLMDFDPSDPSAMLRLLDRVTLRAEEGRKGEERLGPETANAAALYTDPATGKAVTGADIVAKLKALDPGFDGRFTLDYVRSTLRRQLEGQRIRLQRAEQTGHKMDANNLRKWRVYTSELGREMNAWPAQQSYMQLREDFLDVWQSPTATPTSRLNAWREYSSSLTRLANDQQNPLDDNTRTRILAEVNGDSGVDSLAESFTGLSSANNVKPEGYVGDIAGTHFDVQRLLAMQQAVAAGQAVWTTGVTDQSGAFRPMPGGPEIGAATPQDVQAASPVPVVAMFVPEEGQEALQVYVTGVNVDAFALDERGLPVTTTDRNPVGAAYDVTINGIRTRVYSYKGGDGRLYYTADAPWDGKGVRVNEDKSGIHLDLSAYVPRRNEDGGWVYPNGQAVDVLSGRGPFGLTKPNQAGDQSLVMNPTLLTYQTDPARAAAGPDPATDFFSPTLAALMSTPEGQQTLSTLRDDPRFLAQLQLEAQAAATMPNGQVDQSLLNRFNTQVQLATHLNETADAITGFIERVGELFDRTTTKPTFASEATARNTGPAFGGASLDERDERAATLPSDQVRGTLFSPLGDIFERGSSILRRVGEDEVESGGLNIQTQGTLRVPAPPPPRPVASPTPTTTSTVKPPPAPKPVQPPRNPNIPDEEYISAPTTGGSYYRTTGPNERAV